MAGLVGGRVELLSIVAFLVDFTKVISGQRIRGKTFVPLQLHTTKLHHSTLLTLHLCVWTDITMRLAARTLLE